MTGTDRARPRLEVGSAVNRPDGVAKLIGFDTSAVGRPEVLLDYGDRVERIAWVDLVEHEQITHEAAHPHEPDAALLSELTPQERHTVYEAVGHVQQVVTGSRSGTPDLDRELGLIDPRYDPALVGLSRRKATKVTEMRLAGVSGWSRAQLNRKIADFQADGPAGLVHKSRTTISDYLAGVDPRVAEVAREVADRNKAGSKVSQKALLVILCSELQQKDLGQDLSAAQLRRILGEASRGKAMHHTAAGRHRHAIKPVRVYGGRIVSRPGEMIQIDATRTNLHLREPTTGQWLPGNILTAIDVVSRDVRAMRVIVGAVSAREVGLLLFDMSQPAMVRTGRPNELEAYHGVPQAVVVNATPDPQGAAPALAVGRPALKPTTIVMDRGSENTSKAVLSMCSRLGIDVVWAPPGAGYAKGFIESVQRSSDYVASLFDSYKGAEPTNHPRRAVEPAEFTRARLEAILWEWIETVYRHHEHRGMLEADGPDAPRTPAQAFNAYMQSGGYVELEPDPWAYLEFLHETTARVQDYGLRVGSRVYASPDTVDLRPYAQAGVGASVRDLPVRYDPYDVSRIFVRHPATGDWLCVPVRNRDQGTRAPYSDLARVFVSREARADGVVLNDEQVLRAEAELRTRWITNPPVMGNERLTAAVEASRRDVVLTDRDHAGPAVHALIQAADDIPAPAAKGHDSYPDPVTQALLGPERDEPSKPGDNDDPLATFELYVVRDDDAELGLLSYDDEDDFSLDDYDLEDLA